jgi:signal transduction histidine kinase
MRRVDYHRFFFRGDTMSDSDSGEVDRVRVRLLTHRTYCVIAGVLLPGFWFAYRAADPTAVDPLWLRIVLALMTFGVLGASYLVPAVRRNIIALTHGLFYLYTVWFIALSAANAFSPNYSFGLLFVISAIAVATGIGLDRTRPLVFYLVFAVVLTTGAVFMTGETEPGSIGRAIFIGCVASIAVVIYVASSTSIRTQARLEQSEQRYRNSVRELARTNQTLRQRNRELTEIANVASHDLQEPLRKIRTFGDLLTEEYAGTADETGRYYLDRMRANAARMSAILSDLLEFTRLGARPRPFQAHGLTEIVQQITEELKDAIRVAEAQIEIEPLPVIEIDPLQMRALFRHLIANALKFRQLHTCPHIQISSREINRVGEDGVHRRFFEIVISDNGIGFEEKYIDRIFSPFQRLHGHLYDGTGIGLAICRRVAENHGGTITASSEPGRGSRFMVRLPAVHEGTIKP